MVERYYVDQITQYSRTELQEILQAATPPICLLGGWAVHLHVTNPFESATGREYIGSRDIDLGVHVDPDASPGVLEGGAIGRTLDAIEELGFQRSRFGFTKTVERETGKRVPADEAGDYPMHELFEVNVDILPDRREPGNFEQAFGFRPPAEPLLNPVFEGGAGDRLTDYVEFSVSNDVLIADVPILTAMKVRSAPDRDKSQKQVKDIADLHALLWYVTDVDSVIEDVEPYLSPGDIERLRQSMSEGTIEQVAGLLGIDAGVVQTSTDRLMRECNPTAPN